MYGERGVMRGRGKRFNGVRKALIQYLLGGVNKIIENKYLYLQVNKNKGYEKHF